MVAKRIVEERTDEYFMGKFDACDLNSKCKSIYDNYQKYSMAQIMAEHTRSKVRIEKLDECASVNFRHAGQKLKRLNESEMTAYITYINEKMLQEMALEKKNETMLNVKLIYGTILRQLPDNLTPEQQAIKSEMEQVLSSYFVKIENVM